MKEQDRLLAETAVKAGEIMLVSGAEISRVEDTIHHILGNAGQEGQAIVFSTGIFVNLKSGTGEDISLMRRVADRETNLNRICQVNEVSRELCQGLIKPGEALGRLGEIRAGNQYSPKAKSLSYVWVAFFFGIVMGGGLWECIGAALTGGALGLVVYGIGGKGFNSFCVNGIGAFGAGLAALAIQRFLLPQADSGIVIISSIMPLVPGMIFTTAVRDTLNGDYASGAARMLEALVTALAVAAGVGAGMALFGWLAGGAL